MKTSFVHIGITVSNLEATVAWYSEYFDFTVNREFTKDSLEIRAAVLTSGNCSIEAIEPEHLNKVAHSKKSLIETLRYQGLNHFALSVDNITGLFERMKDDGVKVISDLIDNRLFFCEDPDGIVIEVKSL